MDTSDERGGLICGDTIDRDMEGLDPLSAKDGVQPIDERSTGPRDRARRSEQDTNVASERGPRRTLIYGRGRPLVSIAPPASGGVPRCTVFFPRLR